MIPPWSGLVAFAAFPLFGLSTLLAADALRADPDMPHQKTGGAKSAERIVWPEAAALPVRPQMPDPFVMMDGRRVSTALQWANDRRPELKAMFQHYMYGKLPPKPDSVRIEMLGEHGDLFGGKGTLKLVRLHCGAEEGAPRIDLALFLPKEPRPAPVFLAMNFCGNHAVSADPRIPLTRGWLYDSCKGCATNHATEAARGAQSVDWPIEQMLHRGFGLATFCTTDIDSDRKDVSDGVYAWLARKTGRPALAQPADRGTISAWAWGFHRCVDYLVEDAAIDRGRIAVVGHSRNGKTALLAAALDERIALAIPHQAGCGGTAPNRGTVGESVKRINDSFPHWFNGEFKKFNTEPARLPFDQHCLVALCAPRPVLFSNAQEDQWANPNGQFEVLKAADPVYRFLKAGGLDAKEMPELGQLVKSRLGYYIRPGKHSMTAEDWGIFMDFAQQNFRF
jgi:hypothetical protein